MSAIIYFHLFFLNVKGDLLPVTAYYVLRGDVVYQICPTTFEEKPTGDEPVELLKCCKNLGGYDKKKIIPYNLGYIDAKKLANELYDSRRGQMPNVNNLKEEAAKRWVENHDLSEFSDTDLLAELLSRKQKEQCDFSEVVHLCKVFVVHYLTSDVNYRLADKEAIFQAAMEAVFGPEIWSLLHLRVDESEG